MEQYHFKSKQVIYKKKYEKEEDPHFCCQLMSADILSFIYYDWKVRHAIVQKKTKLVESDKSNHIFFDTTNAHVCNRVKQEDF